MASGRLRRSLRLHQNFERAPGLRHEAYVARNVREAVFRGQAGGENGADPWPFDAHGPREIDPVHEAWEANVCKEESDILRVIPKIIQRFLGAGGLDDLEVRLLQQGCGKASDLEVILDDQCNATGFYLLAHAVSPHSVRYVPTRHPKLAGAADRLLP